MKSLNPRCFRALNVIVTPVEKHIASFLVFKNIIAAKEITMAAVLRKEIEQYIEDNKGNVAKRKYNNKETLRVYADLPKELVTEFREVVSENSEMAASVFRKAIEKYVEDNE